MNKKQLLSALLAGALSLSLAAPALAAEAETTAPSYPVLTQDGAQYVPLRAIAEDLGLSVAWDQATLTATVSNDVWSIQLQPMAGTAGVSYVEGAVEAPNLLQDDRIYVDPDFLAQYADTVVTVDGETHPLPQPFFVIATQNPTGASGTQLLPDSQMDRFTIRLSIGYPSPADERELVIGRQQGNPVDQVRQVVSRQELLALQNQADSVYIKPEVVDYMVALIGATRDHPMILRGASPRATLSMASMAKAVAMLKGRDFVTPDDVKTVLIDTISHRLLLAPEAEARGISAATLLQEILRKTPSPKLR